VVAEFAAEIGSLEVLQMMYVLTCADLAAVGPGTLNSWRRDVITRLYHRTRRQLAGDASSSESDEWEAGRRREIRELAGDAEDRTWWDQHIAALPPSYLAGVSTQHIVEELERLRCLPHNDAAAWGRYCEERKATEYTVGTFEEITPGIFHKLTGALSSKGLKILSAEIHTLADQMVLDRFYVSDMDHEGPPPDARIDEVTRTLIDALKTPRGEQPTFRRLWAEESRSGNTPAMRLPTQVRVDNSSSDRYTILDIFAHDRMGLLFTITRSIFEQGLSVHIAKIGTYLDQVVDVFYVTDQKGAKIADDFRLYEIRMQLKKEIEAFTSGEINASSSK
jgi:[protein-PII] uridylyltransferase